MGLTLLELLSPVPVVGPTCFPTTFPGLVLPVVLVSLARGVRPTGHLHATAAPDLLALRRALALVLLTLPVLAGLPPTVLLLLTSLTLLVLALLVLTLLSSGRLSAHLRLEVHLLRGRLLDLRRHRFDVPEVGLEQLASHLRALSLEPFDGVEPHHRHPTQVLPELHRLGDGERDGLLERGAPPGLAAPLGDPVSTAGLHLRSLTRLLSLLALLTLVVLTLLALPALLVVRSLLTLLAPAGLTLTVLLPLAGPGPLLVLLVVASALSAVLLVPRPLSFGVLIVVVHR